jgi:hypothetical protein
MLLAAPQDPAGNIIKAAAGSTVMTIAKVGCHLIYRSLQKRIIIDIAQILRFQAEIVFRHMLEDLADIGFLALPYHIYNNVQVKTGQAISKQIILIFPYIPEGILEFIHGVNLFASIRTLPAPDKLQALGFLPENLT